MGQTQVQLVGGALDKKEELALYLGVAALVFTAYQTWLMHKGQAKKNPYIPKKQLMDEHRKLLKLLRKEVALQARELREYQKSKNPEPCEYVARVSFVDQNKKHRFIETKPFSARTIREASDRLWQAVKKVMPVGEYRLEQLGVQIFQC